MDWMSLIERHGLASAMLVAIVVGMWTTASYLKPHFEKVVASHLKTLRCVRRSLRVQATLLEQSAEQLKVQGSQVHEIHRELLGVRPTVNGKV